MSVTRDGDGSPAIFRGRVGLVSGHIFDKGHVWVDLPSSDGTHASITVRAGKEPNLWVIAEWLHPEVAELIDELRTAWREWRRTELPREIARLKAELGADE